MALISIYNLKFNLSIMVNAWGLSGLQVIVFDYPQIWGRQVIEEKIYLNFTHPFTLKEVHKNYQIITKKLSKYNMRIKENF